MGMIDEEVEQKYFMDALKLFHDTKWLYNIPVTEILTENILDQFPREWLNALEELKCDELNEFVVRRTARPEWPNAFKAFIAECINVNRLPTINPLRPVQLPRNFTIGLNNKKQHEITHLAHLVHSHCMNREIDVIVDFGAGLGYVCQLLHHLYGYKVLGLEKNESYVRDAKSRQQKFYESSIPHVKYATCDITCDSVERIETILSNQFPESMSVCLIGLHACGDLSVHASKIFREMRAAKMFIMIPCCYHKFTIKESTGPSSERQQFHSFPMSRCLRDAITDCNFDTANFLRRPFLRLAAQEPADRWNDMNEKAHDQHSFHVLARAVLQLYAKTIGVTLIKRVQKATRLSQCTDFETYVKDALLRYKLEPVERTEIEKETYETHVDNVKKLWEQFYEKKHIVELYTGLQLMLQAPAESLVLKDRLCWMQEQGFDADIVPVMDKCLSPRSCAIVSHKEDA